MKEYYLRRLYEYVVFRGEIEIKIEEYVSSRRLIEKVVALASIKIV